MIVALCAACLGWVATAWILTAALREKDRSHNLQVSGLLNRIQAPETTVAQALVSDDEHETMILPHTEESYWDEIHHVKAAD